MKRIILIAAFMTGLFSIQSFTKKTNEAKAGNKYTGLDCLKHYPDGTIVTGTKCLSGGLFNCTPNNPDCKQGVDS